jgi:predicted TIM-barrel fold metal-dependent hydrolase
MPMNYWDCNVEIGYPQTGMIKPCPTAADLLVEMDWAGIERALVHHALMRDQSPVVGNAVLAAEIAGQPRLVGTWAILPPQTGELPPSPAFFKEMAAANVRALWAFSDDHSYILDRIVFGAFLDELAQRHIPLFIMRSAGWPVLYTLLAQYPSLTVVMAAHGPWGEDRYFRPLLEHYTNFYLDISRYELDCGIRDIVNKYGPKRLLMGSNYPNAPMGGSRLMLANGDIDDSAHTAIASGNLSRLLGKVDLS